MSIFSGIFLRSSTNTWKDVFRNTCLSSFAGHDIAEHEDSSINLILHLRKNTARSKFIAIDDEGVITIIGEVTLLNFKKLKDQLSCKREITALEIVAELYKREGIGCIEKLIGEYSFVIYDSRQKVMHAVKDPFGQRPLYYYTHNDTLIFSNRIQVLSSLSFSAPIDNNWVLDFLSENNTYRDKTIFQNIKRLLPGHVLTVTPDNISYRPYWDIEKHNTDISCSNIEAAAEMLRNYFKEAVCISLNDDIGIELSGGMDSNAIGFVASKYFMKPGKSLVAFSNVLPNSYKIERGVTDDWENISRTAELLKIDKLIRVDEHLMHPIAALDHTLNLIGYPTNLHQSVSLQGIYKNASDQGISTLLSGFGGNELVTENANVRYVTQLIKNADYLGLIGYFHSHDKNIVKAILKMLYYSFQYLSKQEKRHFERMVYTRWHHVLLKDEILNDGFKKFFFETSYYPPNQTLREKSIYRLNSGTTADRIEIGYFLAHSYGVQCHYPLLYSPLIEFYYNLPDEWKAADKRGRGLFRKAMKDILPDYINSQLKVMNAASATVPFYQIEVEQKFDELRNWCMDIPANNMVFDYIDRNKIEKLNYVDASKSKFQYDLLKGVIGLSLFFDRRREQAI